MHVPWERLWRERVSLQTPPLWTDPQPPPDAPRVSPPGKVADAAFCRKQPTSRACGDSAPPLLQGAPQGGPPHPLPSSPSHPCPVLACVSMALVTLYVASFVFLFQGPRGREAWVQVLVQLVQSPPFCEPVSTSVQGS